MSKTKTRCFLSYCHQDIDRNDLEFFLDLLESHSNQKYEILIDQKLEPGSDINEFMELLNTVDAVIVVLSPEYQRRVVHKEGGVYREFKTICNRYEQLQEEKKQGKKTGDIVGFFELIPILFAGTAQTSVPDELKNLLYLDLVGFRSTSKESATEAIKRKYLPSIKKIVDKLQLVTTLKTKAFKELYEEYFGRLFLETKADWYNPRDKEHNYVETVFVRTLAYKKIKSRTVFFMIGRKGSGKSTVADILPVRQRERYKDIIRVNADEFNLEQLYAFFDHDKIRSDMKNVFRRITCFQFSWEAFFYCCCIDILIVMEKRGALAPHQSVFAPPLTSFLQNLTGEGEKTNTISDKSPYFIYSFNAISRFMEDCIKTSRANSEHFHSDIAFKFNLTNFLTFTFGEEVLKSFHDLIDTCTRGFLITLDGFDTAFDMYRRESIIRYPDDLNQRAGFETDWLRAFLLLVLDIKERRRGTNRFYDLMEFCVTVPKDRFLELLRTERDSYRYTHRYCSLHWSGIELALLLRKRLEELSQFTTNKNDKLVESRLAEVMRERFHHVPQDINITFNGKSYAMPLFMYVLRHTFWRPRDILLFYAKVLSAAESMRRRGLKISVEAIRRTVQDTTYEVIKSEFINELGTTVLNIKDIIESFYGCPQIMPCERVEEILSSVDFKYAYGEGTTIDINEKIEFLYQVGFLGLVANSEMNQRLKMITNEAFYFNAGLLPLRTALQEKCHNSRIMIHPIFCEYLQLNTSNQELTLLFRWDQLHDMEDLLFASGTAFLAF